MSAVACLLGMVTTTWAQEYSPVPMQPLLGTAPRIESPSQPVYSMGLPSPQRPPLEAPRKLFHRAPAQPPAPSGWTGYGFGGIPTYQWGYFGAHYHEVKSVHRGYYGHRVSYGYRRGY